MPYRIALSLGTFDSMSVHAQPVCDYVSLPSVERLALLVDVFVIESSFSKLSSQHLLKYCFILPSWNNNSMFQGLMCTLSQVAAVKQNLDLCSLSLSLSEQIKSSVFEKGRGWMLLKKPSYLKHHTLFAFNFHC